MSVGFNGMGAAYFDGDHPVAEDVSLHIANDNLQIGLDSEDIIFWRLGDIRLVPDQSRGKDYTLRSVTDPLARLIVADKTLLRHLPAARRPAPARGRRRLFAWAMAAVAAVALQITVLVPFLADRLANFIPPAGEAALGEATLGQIRRALDETGMQPLAICDASAGEAALTSMITALNAGEGAVQDLNVLVLDHPMVNAFALPGGIVVLFDGLIQQAQSPDEVAAVLAHEIGHVVSRDPTRHALRSAGSIGVLGLLFGDFAGGAVVLFLAERLISATYTQQAETEADAFGHKLLATAGVSPKAMGAMFERMRQTQGEANPLMAHFLSHPSFDDRITAAQNAARAQSEYSAIVDANAWDDLRRICD